MCFTIPSPGRLQIPRLPKAGYENVNGIMIESLGLALLPQALLQELRSQK